MNLIQSLIQHAEKTKHSFSDILKTAEEVFASHSRTEILFWQRNCLNPKSIKRVCWGRPADLDNAGLFS